MTPSNPRRTPAIGLAVAAAALLAGCTSFSPDGGFGPVAGLTRERTGHAPAYVRTPQQADTAAARVAELLAQPLDAEGAVEIAFLNHRGLQAGLQQLGIAESDLVSAGRLGNPVLGLGRLRGGGGGLEIERSVTFNLLGLLTLPAALQLERQRFEQVQLQAAADAVGVALQARRAYYAAVAAQQLVQYAEQVQAAADASNELAQRMLQAGNFNQLAQLREQAFHADATTALARARHDAVAARERLARALGLAGEQLGFRLPERLPDLPPHPAEPHDAERIALEKRLDVLAARRAAASAARALGLTEATRYVDALEAGYRNKSASGEPRADGAAVELTLPLFDFGTPRLARAEAAHRQALHRAAEVAVNARSEVRESYSAYRTAYDTARHYRDEVVPLRRRIAHENLLRYNGMLIGVFDLLADAREQVRGVAGAIEALRDFWIADARLQTALSGRSPGADALVSSPSSAPTPAPGGAAH